MSNWKVWLEAYCVLYAALSLTSTSLLTYSDSIIIILADIKHRQREASHAVEEQRKAFEHEIHQLKQENFGLNAKVIWVLHKVLPTISDLDL